MLHQLPFVDLYYNDARNEWIVSSWVREAAPGDSESAPAVVPRGEGIVIAADGFGVTGYHIILEELRGFSRRMERDNPTGCPNLRLAVNMGWIFLKRLHIQFDEDVGHFRIHILHRDGRGGYTSDNECALVPLTRTPAEFSEAVMQALSTATDAFPGFVPASQPDPSALRNLLSSLAALGFYRYVTVDSIPRVIEASVQIGALFPDSYRYRPDQQHSTRIVDFEPDLTRRAFLVDAENLFEEGLELFLNEMRPVLARFGATMDGVRRIVQSDELMVVIIGAHEFRTTCSESVIRPGRWFCAAACAFKIVNEVLRASSAMERLFYDFRGNDSRIAFMTNGMYRLVASSRILCEVAMLDS